MVFFLPTAIWIAFVTIFFPPRASISRQKKSQRKRICVSQPEPEPVAMEDEYVKFVSNIENEFRTLSSKKFLLERGFSLPIGGSFEVFRSVIEHHKWETFCAPRTEYMKSHVLEFYTNSSWTEASKVCVRGKEVDYSAQAINELFGLTPNPQNEYFYANISTQKRSQILQAVCKDPPTQVSYTSARKNIIFTKHLTRAAKVWNLFICSSLMPVSHTSDISMERLFLIYCIMEKKVLDVGVIIHNFIYDYIRLTKPGRILFPCLITALCKKNNVPIKDEEYYTTVKSDINQTVILQYVKIQGVEGPPPLRHRESVAPNLDLAGINESLKAVVAQLRLAADYSRKTFSRLSSLHDVHRLNIEKLCIHSGMNSSQLVPFPLGQFDDEGYLIPTALDLEALDYEYGEGLYYRTRQVEPSSGDEVGEAGAGASGSRAADDCGL